MNITFTSERIDAWEEMLNVSSGETLESKLQDYLNVIADKQIEDNLDETFKAKTKSEKENLLS